MFLIGTWGVLRAVPALDEFLNRSLMNSLYFRYLFAPVLISVVLSVSIRDNSTDSEGSIHRIQGVLGLYNEENVSKIRADVSQLEPKIISPQFPHSRTHSSTSYVCVWLRTTHV